MNAFAFTKFRAIRVFLFSGTACVALSHQASAQQTPQSANATEGWQRYDWLAPAQDQNASVSAKTTQNVKDPFTAVTSGAIWQETDTTTYNRKIADGLILSYESSSTLINEMSTGALPGTPDDLNRGEKASVQVQPAQAVSFQGNVHATTTDSSMPGSNTMTSGAGFSAEGQLPTNSTVTLGVNSDRTGLDSSNASITTSNSYDAQLKQPVGNLPLSAILKGHVEEVQSPGSPLGRTPSLEQSLTWKPAEDTTVQMGLRQQQYQEYPGVDNQFNQAVFADFSQKLVSNITWHSYGELLNTKGLVDQAPAAPLASGSNGTAQATGPGDSLGGMFSSPLSLQDQTLTLSTGPSFQLQKDISASVEYSDRIDKSITPGVVNQEQRVSLSVKGSF